MDIKTALATARAFLQENEIETPRLDAEVLLAHVLQCSRAGLYANSHRELNENEIAQYKKLVEKRAGGQPVAYLVGQKEFMGLDFTVSPAVLIPRPDTELLVETAVSLLKKSGAAEPLAVDVGTGSGAIAVTLAHFVPELEVLAVDVSKDALEVAGQNARLHGVENRIKFLQGNLLEPVIEQYPGLKADIICANLPYVPSGDIPQLAREVKSEPLTALDGGPDGLDFYRQLVPQAEKVLKPGGYLLIEIGPGQGEPSLQLFEGWKEAKLYHDLGGRERLVAAQV